MILWKGKFKRSSTLGGDKVRGSNREKIRLAEILLLVATIFFFLARCYSYTGNDNSERIAQHLRIRRRRFAESRLDRANGSWRDTARDSSF